MEENNNPLERLIEFDNVKKTLSNYRHNANGEELLDPVPMQPPLGYKKTPTLSEQIAQQVRRMKLELLQDDSVSETEEEADDFEIGDDFEPISPHENDHIPSIAVLKKRALEINNQIKEANRRAAIAAHETALKKPMGVTTPSPNAEPEPKAPKSSATDQ